MHTRIHHLNCGTLRVEGYPVVVCHCLLLEDAAGLALVDTGIGLLDVAEPAVRLGRELVEAAGFQFHASDTAVRRIAELGLAPEDVGHIVLTHADADHTGGLADFPAAKVHLAAEEHQAVASGHGRYVQTHFAHQPHWVTYDATQTVDWFGVAARPVRLGFASQVLLVPLPGHTAGHCGVAVQQHDGWLLHVGDAYYLRAEISAAQHPVSALASQRAESDEQRLASLQEIRRLYEDHRTQIQFCGYHDFTELPADVQLRVNQLPG